MYFDLTGISADDMKPGLGDDLTTVALLKLDSDAELDRERRRRFLQTALLTSQTNSVIMYALTEELRTCD